MAFYQHFPCLRRQQIEPRDAKDFPMREFHQNADYIVSRQIVVVDDAHW